MKTPIFSCIIAFFLLSVISCSDTVKTDPDGNIIGPGGNINEPVLEEDEKIEQMITVDYRGNLAELAFSNDVKFSIRPENNPNAGNEKIAIALLENDRFFNTDNDIVFDFSVMNNPFIVDLEYTLPAGLEDDDIALLLYSPGTSIDEFDHHEVSYTYNADNGKLTASFSAPDSNPFTGKTDSREIAYKSGSKYSRLNISWSMRKELLTEGPHRKIIKMPFYEQSYNTCWAASVKMMGRAYSSVANREMEMRLHDVVKHMNHSDFNGGAGIYAFRFTLPRYLRNKTNVNFETSSFLRTSALQYEIVKKISENKPVILNLRFPGIGGHQIVVIGYEIDMVSAAKSTLKLLYHNPQNADVPGVGLESMYTWADFEWLMKDKWAQELYQILYTDRPVPDNRPLQTLATPILDRPISEGGSSVGTSELAIVIERKRPSTGEIVDLNIDMVYDRQKTDGYKWMLRNRPDDIELDVIPDSVRAIKLVQPVYNADDVSENLTLLVEAYDLNDGERLHTERVHKQVAHGMDRFNMRIPLDDFFDAEEEREITVYVQLLKDDHLFLDGYRFKFTLEPRESIMLDYVRKYEITRLFTRWNDVFGETHSSMTQTRYNSDDYIQLSFSGESFLRRTPLDQIREEEDKVITWSGENVVSVRFDDNKNPKEIAQLRLSGATTYRVDYLGLKDRDGKDVELYETEESVWESIYGNISINEDNIQNNDIVIKITGAEVCDYIISNTSNSYSRTYMNDVLSSSVKIDLGDYFCKDDAELSLRIRR